MYLELYDERLPDMRAVLDPFLVRVGQGLQAQGLEVETGPVCRVQAEVRAALDGLRTSAPDLLVVLHLAYSPSLESVDELVAAGIPVLLLDITMDAEFGLSIDPERVLYNHGIHGVQDLAAMLRRREYPYEIVAGYAGDEVVYNRAARIARAAAAATALQHMKVLRIGESFQGMGDFVVSPQVLKDRWGVLVKQLQPDQLATAVEHVTTEELKAERQQDQAAFECDLSQDVLDASNRVGLGVRKMLDAEGYGAFSMNFMAFQDSSGPVDRVPFLEASKAMARGVGYAGEGDVLTASLVGALLAGFPSTTFTEIFCPDWQGNALFLSHMGEFNPKAAAQTPRVFEKPFPFTGAANPAVLTCAPKPGPGCFVNLAPGPDDSFALLVSEVELLGDGTHPGMRDVIRGWMRVSLPLPEFLETYSRLGGTHHSALIPEVGAEALEAFARMVNVPCHVLR